MYRRAGKNVEEEQQHNTTQHNTRGSEPEGRRTVLREKGVLRCASGPKETQLSVLLGKYLSILQERTGSSLALYLLFIHREHRILLHFFVKKTSHRDYSAQSSNKESFDQQDSVW